ncbi:hypothetical protein ARMGADRAFT_589216 [Armillaria gallica]|uniref:Uncharacterized protein n=1 Tax=Armillaria gallica TaxID=47427 RepID=A0A2H3EHK6_ARMGA|nr:hypothetical protein ARMGADRAFT_589216 [Armillaria gallica]
MSGFTSSHYTTRADTLTGVTTRRTGRSTTPPSWSRSTHPGQAAHPISSTTVMRCVPKSPTPANAITDVEHKVELVMFGMIHSTTSRNYLKTSNTRAGTDCQAVENIL